MSKIFLFILFLVAGALSAVAFIYIFGTSLVRFDNPILSIFDVKKPEVVGFLPYWLLDKADKKYSRYITTLTYFGLALNSDGTVKKLNNPQEEEPGWTTLKSGKYASKMADAKNHNIKQSLLVISGDDGVIGDIIANPVTSANNLVAQVAPIMKDKGFTDLNLDIETFIEGSSSSQLQFTRFAQTVKDELVVQKLGTLTIDLIPIALVKPKLYDAKALVEIAVSIILMTYDYHYLG
ncbi:MAG: glycosyl hydrolase family 18 protein, partial [Candidatus Gottesmanbacteria bacterium]|nr:glycosyl hydrolase family 18 protein [Candidatus Gottesmanbacteria bacterium]